MGQTPDHFGTALVKVVEGAAKFSGQGLAFFEWCFARNVHVGARHQFALVDFVDVAEQVVELGPLDFDDTTAQGFAEHVGHGFDSRNRIVFVLIPPVDRPNRLAKTHKDTATKTTAAFEVETHRYDGHTEFPVGCRFSTQGDAHSTGLQFLNTTFLGAGSFGENAD